MTLPGEVNSVMDAILRYQPHKFKEVLNADYQEVTYHLIILQEGINPLYLPSQSRILSKKGSLAQLVQSIPLYEREGQSFVS